MRKSIIAGVLFLGILGFGCQQAKVNVQTDALVQNTENWEVNIKKSVFSSEDKKAEEGCTAVNEKVQYLIDSLQSSLKSEADTFFATYGKSADYRPLFSYQLYVTDSVFRADNDYISLRLLVYSFQGGAHGMTDFYAINYDMKSGTFLNDSQIINMDKAKEIDLLLSDNFKNSEGCFTEKPTLANGYTALNIGSSALCFTYPQYVLGPYSCGYAQVSIPLENAGAYVKISGK